MRALLICLSCLAIACSGTDATRPDTRPEQPPPVASIVIEMPSTLVIGTSAPAKVTLMDANRNPLSRPLTFATSDPSVAIVDQAGVVTAVKEGDASITVSSEGKSARGTVSVIRPAPETCRLGFDFCVINVYDLKQVNGQALPIKSPWGIGEWDYDSLAGTWMLVGAALTLFRDGAFQFSMAHSAASGAAIFDATSGSYVKSAGSLVLTGHKGERWSATVTGETLTVEWATGLTFTFKARFSD